VSIDSVSLAAGIPAEALVVALLLWRRVYRQLPIFSAYLVWGLLIDCAMPVLQSHFPGAYIRIYLVESSLDSLLQYGILVELAWAVLRPFHAMPPRRVLAGSALGVLMAGALAWPFSSAPETVAAHWDFVLIIRLQQTFSILRVAVFLVLAIASHWLTMGWRNRELQVAAGLGVYSLVGLAGSLVHKHQSVTAPSYHWVEVAISASYVGSLLYWAVSFGQKEPPRPALPEHAKDVLSELTQTARGHRAAVEKRQRVGKVGELK
jgi:hypothetical protein